MGKCEVRMPTEPAFVQFGHSRYRDSNGERLKRKDEEKVWTLIYTGDLVLLAREEIEMEMMMRRLEKYMDREKLKMIVGKRRIK